MIDCYISSFLGALGGVFAAEFIKCWLMRKYGDITVYTVKVKSCVNEC